jgi:formiminoglutamate deiminase
LLEACKDRIARRKNHRLGWAPHSLRAVSEQQLRIVLDALPEAGLPVHIHIAEQPAEVEECKAQSGSRPVDYLMDHFPVDASWCLVHATHLSDSELLRAASSGATAGLCPSTEADLGDGFFSAEAWIENGGVFGIGSDSNLRIDVAEELRLLEFGCRLRALGRNLVSDEGMSCGRSLFQRAVAGGSAALAQNIGQIAPGYRADLVELDAHHPLLEGRNQDGVLDAWIFAGGPDMVRSVWVSGNLRVKDGKHIVKDVLEKSFQQAARELL